MYKFNKHLYDWELLDDLINSVKWFINICQNSHYCGQRIKSFRGKIFLFKKCGNDLMTPEFRNKAIWK